MNHFIEILISSYRKLASFGRSTWFFIVWHYRYIALRVNPFFVRFCYFLALFLLGFGMLKGFKPRIESFFPRNLDLFYTAVSAATNSGLNVIEMENLSNSQLGVLTFLMLASGEIFVSMIGVFLTKQNLRRSSEIDLRVGPVNLSHHPSILGNQIELTPSSDDFINNSPNPDEVQIPMEPADNINKVLLQKRSITFLGLVLISYLVGFHLLGVLFVLSYLNVISTTKQVLNTKGLKLSTFTIFTTVATFSNSGFMPTNENMAIFNKNSGLLLALIVLSLIGNTLFPPCLRLIVWCVRKFCKKEESDYLLNCSEDLGYRHLLPAGQTLLLTVTVFAILAVQVVMFAAMNWSSDALSGLNGYQKMVGSLFMSVNSRHTGESTVDLSVVSPAVLVLFVVIMYLPPYTSFRPVSDDLELPERRRRSRGSKVENIIWSQVSYVIIFIILVCITEREKIKSDPRNFSIFNIIAEVVSAYGNVGLSIGYSCERLLVNDINCQDKMIAFSGKWSDEGKIILIIVMFFGRLKNFHMGGGKAWKLM